MKVLLIGHRGTGKTSLLRRMAQYFPDHDVVDLDSEIERLQGESISAIFTSKGEKAFRRLEHSTFLKIQEGFEGFPNAIIALGAGFDFELPKDYEVIFVKRDSDSDARVFIERPSLSKDRSQRDEYLMRFEQREKRYLKLADRVWTLPEGSLFPCEQEKNLLLEKVFSLGGFLTIIPEHFFLRNPTKLWTSYLAQGIEGFEFRNDLLTEEMLKIALAAIPKNKRLFSYRLNAISDFKSHDAKWIDWDVELGECRNDKTWILSWHGRCKTIEDSIQYVTNLSRQCQRVKWAPEVNDLLELSQIHKWLESSGLNVSFLPRTPKECSSTRDWSWYRLLRKGQTLNFWRDASGSSADQPLLHSWCLTPTNIDKFAAVLGSPVKQSFSPGWHRAFFLKRSCPFFYIEANRESFTKDSLEFLFSLGLRYAAVTSPLKEILFEFNTVQHDLRAQRYQALNTLVWSAEKHSWLSTNTDYEGFHALVEDLPRDHVVVWGGGGTRSVIREVYPQAAFYSARRGELLTGVPVDPKILIWAAGPSAPFPHQLWQPRMIVDLSYTSDSKARDYALKIGAKYRSGAKMFARQAMKQQAFWGRYGQ